MSIQQFLNKLNQFLLILMYDNVSKLEQSVNFFKIILMDL